MLERVTRRDGTAAGGERGAVAVITAIAATLMLVMAAFCVDIGNAWAVRGKLQVQADDAAVYAAQGLPLQTNTSTAGSSRLDVAKRVAYQVACHPVRGQRKRDPSIPACPSGPGSSTLNTYAQQLLTAGRVTFPDTLSVKVTSPTADVDFGFGNVAGSSGVQEAKSGTARIYSPGSAAPVALSLQCLLTAAGTAPLGIGDLVSGVVPLNYITPGPLGANSTAEQPATVTTSQMPVGTTGILSPLNPTSHTQNGSRTVTPTFTGPTGLLNLATPYRLHFWRAAAATGPAAHYTVDGSYTKALVLPPLASSVNIPAEVASTPGTWYVQLQWATGLSGITATSPYTGKASIQPFTVLPPAGVENLVGCANLVDSPRLDTGNAVQTGETLRRNIKSGMDHALTAHQSLITLSPPASLTTSSLVSTLSGGLLNCAGSPGSVLDDSASKPPPVANCVTIASDGARQAEFTQGFLGDPTGTFKGRLSCAADTTRCATRAGFTVSGLPGTYNDDRIEDFKRPGSILSANLFFGLSSYLTDDLPVVSPPSTALLPGIYSSPRFMWAAIVSRANVLSATATGCGTCPVLTFRPVFLTQDTPTGITALDELREQLKNTVGGLFSVLQPLLFPFLAPAATSTDHGVVMSGANLRALRFQTLEPTSLPVPPASYNGPVSAYLGVGPKIVRLVR